MLQKKDVYKRNVAVRIDAVVFGFGSGCRAVPQRPKSIAQRKIRPSTVQTLY